MLIDKIQRHTLIVVQGRTLRVRDITRDGRKIKLHFNGGHISRKPGTDVPTRAEITAGPVKAQPYARMPHRARFSDGTWRGELEGTTAERIISYSRGWDI